MKFDDLIQIENINVLNSKLLIASASNDSPAVRDLLASVACVNHAGVTRNTPLHCAVGRGNLEIVKLLLENGADVTLENDDIKTPLDIESSNNNQEILLELQKNIIFNSINALQQNQELYKQSKEAVVDDGKPVETSSNRDAAQLENDSTFMNKEVVKEINKKKDKIQSCLKYLTNLNNDSDASKGEITYKKANILLFFLEAIAFRDMDVPTDGKSERRILNELDSNIDNKEVIYDKANIKKEVIDYFINNFYPPSFTDDQRVIDVVRNLLCHETNRKITLKDISKIVCSKTDVTTFFKKLEEYVAYICNNIDGRKDNNPEIKLVLESITKEDKKDMGMEGSDILKEHLIELIGSFYNPEEWTHEKAQEILFNFLVNISPAFQKEFNDLGKLRNKIIHEFYKYEDVDAIIKRVFTRTVFGFGSRLFKKYYAKEVHDILHDIKSGDEWEVIDERLSSALKDFEEKFEKKFHGETKKYLIASQEDTEGSFELKCHQASVYPSIEDTAIEGLVKQYLKYMIIVDESLRSDDVEDEIMIANEKVEISLRRKNLSSTDKREIFERFLNLKQLKQFFPSKYKEEKNEFRNELINNYGIKSEYFEETCRLNIENGEEDCGIATTKSEEQIANTICALRRFQTTYYKLSKNEVIKLYSIIVSGRRNFEIDKLKKMDQEENLTEFAKKEFQNEISMLYKENSIEILIQGKKVKLNTVSVVSNILEAFYSTYNSYQIKFNNIEKAFKDKLFLNHLIDLEIKFRDSRNAGNKIFDYYLGTILKKLLNIDYSSPYIATIITEIGNLKIMEQSDLARLVGILLNENSYIDFLNDLLKINCDGVDILKTVWKKLPNQNLEFIRQILEEPNHAVKIFDILEKSLSKTSDEESIQSVEVKSNVIKLMNSIVSNLYLEGSYHRALKLLDIYVVGEINDTKRLELLEAMRLKGRVKTRIEKLKNSQCKGPNSEHLKVLQIYNTITKTLEANQNHTLETSALYFLTISHKAYTQQLLLKFPESYASIEKLYQEVKNFALGSPQTAEMICDEYSDIIHIMKLKPYCDLIAFSEETKTYLNILKIRESMAVVRASQVKTSSKKDRLELRIEVMNIFKEVYNVHRKIQPEKDLTTAGIVRRLAFATFNVGTLVKNSDEKKSLQYFVEAIDFSMGASKIYKESLRAHPLNLEVSKLISQIIGKCLLVFKNDTEYFAPHQNAISDIKVKYTELLTNNPILRHGKKSNKMTTTNG